MFPGIGGMNPTQMKSLMKQLGIKSQDLKAKKAVFELDDKLLVIDNPQITLIEMQGVKTFQVIGEAKEESKGFPEDDIKLVAEQANVSLEEAKKALQKTNGDIAQAINDLK